MNQKNVKPGTRGMVVRILGIAGMLVYGIAAAQILECVDAKGRKEFANQCPPGTTESRKIMKSGVSSPSGGGSSAPAATGGQKSIAEQDAEFRKRQTERQEAESKAGKERAETDNRRAQCEQSQAQLRALEDGQRMVKTDPKTGERIFIQDDDRPREIDQARKAVQTWCK
jgi:hypothetical protein